MLKGDDKAAIDKKAEALMQAAAQHRAAGRGAQSGRLRAPARRLGRRRRGRLQPKGNDDAVDAEFEEVKDKKKAS